jgi:hypothetical protein
MKDIVIHLRSRTLAEVQIREWRSKTLIGRKRTTRVSQDDVDYIVNLIQSKSLKVNDLVIGDSYFALSYHIDLHRTKIVAKVLITIEPAEYVGIDQVSRCMFKYPTANYLMYFPPEQDYGFNDMTEGISIYKTKEDLTSFLSFFNLKYSTNNDVYIELSGYNPYTESIGVASF